MSMPFPIAPFRGKRVAVLVTAAALLLAASVLARSRRSRRPRKPRPTVTFVSPVECRGDHDKWRWKVKTERDRPLAEIPADHRITPSDVADWEPPEGKITTRTPRVGQENEWYELTGRVTLVKAEEDGDLHIQLRDAKGGGRMQVVVEGPVDHGHPDFVASIVNKSGVRSQAAEYHFVSEVDGRGWEPAQDMLAE
jgi:hypothetical protein